MAVFIFAQDKQMMKYAMPAEQAAAQRKESLAQSHPITTVPKYNHEAKASSFITGKDIMLIVSSLLFCGLCIFFLIASENHLTQTSNELQQAERRLDDMATDKSNLTQEAQELSRYDRVMNIAKEHGLEMNEDNIRNVDK
ncbi:MAG: cell division protein FtsL [Aerococcus suis]|nr:cell division protein FtsL [Aerococcus suis]MDY4646122.1 cell division protein FtsL [Aerococcus suis]